MLTCPGQSAWHQVATADHAAAGPEVFTVWLFIDKEVADPLS